MAWWLEDRYRILQSLIAIPTFVWLGPVHHHRRGLGKPRCVVESFSSHRARQFVALLLGRLRL